ncbi:hypothetical protein GCM10010198_25460 [Nocardia seriolae]|nr:hypothetical protein NSERKGN1266_03900 [Nocardia seriolae]BEK92397.1 hypothetical protein NSER024013_03030 [Nocardia seriolae]GEM28018.1 hypothetical protein NS2_62570 [Nocardia seriolae NBRC 15557]
MVGSWKIKRARKFPNASCCQFTQWFPGLTRIEYASMVVRVCGAGRSRTTCGCTRTGRSKE